MPLARFPENASLHSPWDVIFLITFRSNFPLNKLERNVTKKKERSDVWKICEEGREKEEAAACDVMWKFGIGKVNTVDMWTLNKNPISFLHAAQKKNEAYENCGVQCSVESEWGANWIKISIRFVEPFRPCVRRNRADGVGGKKKHQSSTNPKCLLNDSTSARQTL